MSGAWRGRVQVAGGLAVLGVLVWRFGGGPFLAGVRDVGVGTLVAGAALAVVTTVCCAWRWRLVARGTGVDIGLPAAVAAYYRSQFLNAVLPGGVLGDVHRGLRTGHVIGDSIHGVRIVAWERLAGQVVQVATTLVVLLLVPSPVRSVLPMIAVTAAVVCLVVLVVVRTVPRTGATLRARAVRTVLGELRNGLLTRATWPGVVVASVVALAGHVATFLVAARTAGVTVSAARLLPLALLVLLAMAVPLNVAGWGPREGAAAWVFGVGGLSGSQGVSTAVVYGVMVLVAVLPGALVLLLSWRHRHVAQRADSGARRLVTTDQESARG